MKWHRLLLLAVLFLAGASTRLFAQDCTVNGVVAPCSMTLTVTALPASVAIAWDAAPNATGYKVYDGSALVASPSITTATFALSTTGTHVLTVTAVVLAVESPKSPALTVLLQQAAPQIPPAPSNLRYVKPGTAATACATASAIGTNATTVTDSACHIWTIGAQGQTLRDGVWVSNGSGSTYLWLASGLYVFGTNSSYYKWDDGSMQWQLYGASKPATD